MVQNAVSFDSLKQEFVERLLPALPPGADPSTNPGLMRVLATRFHTMCKELAPDIAEDEQRGLFDDVLAELMGLGPLEPLLRDDSITEIMVNGIDQVWIERHGKLTETGITLSSVRQLHQIINRILTPIGRHLDPKFPMVDARLPDGSRVNIIAAPCSLLGPVVTIRKFFKDPLTADDLINFRTVKAEMVTFLEACVVSRLNIIVAGGTGSGKTTLLNVLSSFIPEDERVVTIEDAAELRLSQRHVVPLEAKPAEIDGTGQVQIRDLVINSLRMRPDRIIVGECRGREALDMLQAMNTGHDGSLTTIHSNSPRDTLSRIETMVLMSGLDLPLRAVREQIASAIDLIVHLQRLDDGSRKVTSITEVQGMEGDVIVLQDIFTFEELGRDSSGVIKGNLLATGIRPKFINRLEVRGFKLPPDVFGFRYK